MPYAATCDNEQEAADRVTELTSELIGNDGTGGVGWESTNFAKFGDGGEMIPVLVLHDFQANVEFNDPDLQEALMSESERIEVILGDVEDVTTHRIVALTAEVLTDEDDDGVVEADPDDPVEL